MSKISKRALSAALGFMVLVTLVLAHKGALTGENMYLALGVSLAMGMSVRFNV